MSPKICAALACVALVLGCSSKRAPPAAKGRIVVALTIDWEGAVISPEALDAVDAARARIGDAPLTHFVSAAYFTKATPDPAAAHTIASAVRPTDELAVHLHAWSSLATASGITPKLAPSFLTGTDRLLPFDDGDVGFDLDLDAYSVSELRALLRTSKKLLEGTALPVGKGFRAGGYLATPKVIQALRDEGFTVDSSAIDARQLDEHDADILPKRLTAIWPGMDPGKQPWSIQAPGGQVLELPIAAVADFSTTAEIVKVFEDAHARLAKAPTRDVFVVLAFHQETAEEFAPRIAEAIEKVRATPALAAELAFTTVDKAAELAKAVLAAPSS